MPFCVKNDSDIYHTHALIFHIKRQLFFDTSYSLSFSSKCTSFFCDTTHFCVIDGRTFSNACYSFCSSHSCHHPEIVDGTYIKSIEMCSYCILKSEPVEVWELYGSIVRESLTCKSSYIVLRGSSAIILYWYPIASHISNINFKKHLSSHQVEFICFWGCIVEVLNGSQ